MTYETYKRHQQQSKERNQRNLLKRQRFGPKRGTNLTTALDVAVCDKVKVHTMCTRSEKPFESNLREESVVQVNVLIYFLLIFKI